MERNGIKAKDFLSGNDEAIAFENKEYIKLHMSTLRKVDVFANLLNRAIDNSLKVNSKWYEIYELSPQGIFDYCKDKWWIQILVNILLLVIGAVIGNII